ncbi:hypothetical protein SC738_10285 [Legionella pneumophila serogroup 1]|uniref:hypothetical protein n=1 Tax=Legionella pneumophila TaxID=446 RepID=UPI0007706EBA|nr:hypothetical protein [Legionella pneumophila]HAT8823321.1 hypothetical protein [Legionella pneumophila subsp. pneumophila]MCZ4737953.1 hypothetical protein [Legionella pneumophila]MCZ4747902.1 hypothetical protein [Legionella pneumophila]MDI9829486.1 hypothetical protein [Legionella pneumophila]MDO5158235.1 hypothetical protein [Legionella pneumophila]
MDSIIRVYDGASSEDASIIVSKFTKYISMASDTMRDNIGQQLTDLLLVPYAPEPAILMLLAQPWFRANMLINFLGSFDLSEEKIRVEEIINALSTARKVLSYWPQKSLDFLLVQTSSEPQIGILIDHLTEIITFLTKFSTLSFRHGEIHNPNYLKRYAIDSLFWMGKEMGLKESGNKPTQLNKYIHLVTDRLYTDIAQDHLKYNNGISYLEKYNQNDYFFLMFIFNPHCDVTKNILSTLRRHLNTRSLIDTP